MKKFGRIAVGLLSVLVSASAARAQATRTWVSGVGDDANPCSRTAPCKTFAGAISKTATGGEINVLDPGGFGGVTITKSITIDGTPFIAGVLVSGTNGIVVNAPSNAQVTLRGLDIDGIGTGLNGITVLGVGTLSVENCRIYGFGNTGVGQGNGISVTVGNNAGVPAKVFVTDSVMLNNASSGIGLSPAGGQSVSASIENVRLEANQAGLRLDDNASATFTRSVASGNATNGVNAVSAGGAVNLSVTQSTIANNTNNGVRSSGGAAAVRLSQVTITRNGTGLSSVGGGAIVSFGTNWNNGNTADGAPTSTIPQQ